ncbi:MAG TPA: sigma-70 family RNA polymerase sigma factor [Elusimicrobiales bacterium]|nr:sigma-70 family RNA polymerase sigma factor [Elusimicrobiales bacterium]
MRYSALRYGKTFENWEVAVAKNVVDGFLRQWECLRPEDFDDLTQEALLHWLQKRNKYRADKKCKPTTFMARVVKNKLRDILKARLAKKRRPKTGPELRFSAPVANDGEDEDSPTLEDAVEDAAAAKQLSDVELKRDMSAATRKLSPRQKLLCKMLAGGMSMSEASSQLSLPRATLYEERNRIQAILIAQGIGDYAK